MNKRFFCLLIASFLVTGIKPVQAQVPARNTVTVKFEPMPQHGGPIITVRLEHDVTARFLVDTGSNMTVLTPEMAYKLKVPISLQLKSGMHVIKLSHLEIGSWDIPGGDFVILDGPLVPSLKQLKIDGILGINFLATCAVFLNWEKQECSLFYPGNLPKDQVEALGFKRQEASPVSFTRETASGLYGVDTQVAGKTQSLLLDTGRQRTILPKSFSVEVLGKPLWERDALTVTGIKKEPVYLVSEILVGGAKVGKQAVLVSKDNDDPLTRMLGMDFLAQFNVLMDFPAEHVYLHQVEGTNPSLVCTYQDEAEGMVVGYDKAIWKVITITSDNRFFRAGVREGDVIESINQADVNGMVSNQVLAELYHVPTPTLCISRLADGKKDSHVIRVPKR